MLAQWWYRRWWRAIESPGVQDEVAVVADQSQILLRVMVTIPIDVVDVRDSRDLATDAADATVPLDAFGNPLLPCPC